MPTPFAKTTGELFNSLFDALVPYMEHLPVICWGDYFDKDVFAHLPEDVLGDYYIRCRGQLPSPASYPLEADRSIEFVDREGKELLVNFTPAVRCRNLSDFLRTVYAVCFAEELVPPPVAELKHASDRFTLFFTMEDSTRLCFELVRRDAITEGDMLAGFFSLAYLRESSV